MSRQNEKERRKLSRNLVRVGREAFANGDASISIEEMLREAYPTFPILDEVLELATEMLPSIKARIEEKEGITLVPVTSFYFDHADEEFTLMDAQKAIAGHLPYGGKTFGLKKIDADIISAAYVRYTQRTVDGKNASHAMRIENVKAQIGSDVLDTIIKPCLPCVE